jgi:glycosyltransferase involved in cell wall biosynthesis
MKLSVGICTHNEGESIDRLLGMLSRARETLSLKFDTELEIVVVDDNSTDERTQEILSFWGVSEFSKFELHELNSDFAAHKNFMTSECTGDWILNLDADEFIDEDLVYYIPQLIESNPTIEAYWFPRVNTVEGLTDSHVKQWGWSVMKFEGLEKDSVFVYGDEEYKFLKDRDMVIDVQQWATVMQVKHYVPVIQWPDYQMRLYKNNGKIKWKNKVHEVLDGYQKYGTLPAEQDYAILHHKHIKKQEEQNRFYSTLQR